MISLHFVSNEERIEISRIINDFQICNYIKSFQKLVQELLLVRSSFVHYVCYYLQTVNHTAIHETVAKAYRIQTG
jgi:hypothetical protein